MQRTVFILLVTLLFSTVVGSPTAAAQKGKKKKDKSAVRDERTDMELRSLFIEAQKERMLGNLYEADKKLKQCLALDPDNHAVFYDLALVADKQQRTEQAQNYAESAVRLSGTICGTAPYWRRSMSVKARWARLKNNTKRSLMHIPTNMNTTTT